MSEPIRITLITFSLVFVAAGAWYRIQSQRSGESLDRTKEGWPILIGLRLAGLMTLVSAVAGLCNAAWFQAATLPIPEVVRWASVATYACAIGWLLWMFHSLGRNLTDTVVTRRNATFVEHGPYRFVRNPTYTGVLIAGISLGVALGSWLVPVLSSAVFAIMALRTRIEEKYLVERFGDQYRQYMVRVGRFLPRLSSGIAAHPLA
jgi:protein-S-isoprenylcysteine O-methyltransferase